MATTVTGLEETARVIRAMDDEFVRNLKSGDITRLVDAFYAEDARLLPPNSPMVSGRTAILERWKAAMAAGVSGLTLNTTHIDVSGDLAYGVGNYVMRMGDRQDNGKYVVVYRRQSSGNWRAVADMFSSDNPA